MLPQCRLAARVLPQKTFSTAACVLPLAGPHTALLGTGPACAQTSAAAADGESLAIACGVMAKIWRPLGQETSTALDLSHRGRCGRPARSLVPVHCAWLPASTCTQHGAAQAACSSSSGAAPGRCSAVAWNHNNKVLASATDQGLLRLHYHTGSIMGELPNVGSPGDTMGPITCLAFSRGSKLLTTGCTDAQQHIWDLKLQVGPCGAGCQTQLPMSLPCPAPPGPWLRRHLAACRDGSAASTPGPWGVCTCHPVAPDCLWEHELQPHLALHLTPSRRAQWHQLQLGSASARRRAVLQARRATLRDHEGPVTSTAIQAHDRHMVSARRAYDGPV